MSGPTFPKLGLPMATAYTVLTSMNVKMSSHPAAYAMDSTSSVYVVQASKCKNDHQSAHTQPSYHGTFQVICYLPVGDGVVHLLRLDWVWEKAACQEQKGR